MHGQAPTEEHYAEKRFHQANGVVFLDDDEWVRLFVRIFNSSKVISNGFSSNSIDVDALVVFEYCKQYRVNKLQVLEIMKIIATRIDNNARETEST